MAARILTIEDIDFSRAIEWTERLATLLLQDKQTEGLISLVSKEGIKITMIGYGPEGAKPSEEKRGGVTEIRSLSIEPVLSRVPYINNAIALVAKYQMVCALEAMVHKRKFISRAEPINYALIRERCKAILSVLQPPYGLRFSFTKKSLTATEQAIVEMLKNNLDLTGINTHNDVERALSQLKHPPFLKNNY